MEGSPLLKRGKIISHAFVVINFVLYKLSVVSIISLGIPVYSQIGPVGTPSSCLLYLTYKLYCIDNFCILENITKIPQNQNYFTLLFFLPQF